MIQIKTSHCRQILMCLILQKQSIYTANSVTLLIKQDKNDEII